MTTLLCLLAAAVAALVTAYAMEWHRELGV